MRTAAAGLVSPSLAGLGARATLAGNQRLKCVRVFGRLRECPGKPRQRERPSRRRDDRARNRLIPSMRSPRVAAADRSGLASRRADQCSIAPEARGAGRGILTPRRYRTCAGVPCLRPRRAISPGARVPKARSSSLCVLRAREGRARIRAERWTGAPSISFCGILFDLIGGERWRAAPARRRRPRSRNAGKAFGRTRQDRRSRISISRTSCSGKWR